MQDIECLMVPDYWEEKNEGCRQAQRCLCHPEVVETVVADALWQDTSGCGEPLKAAASLHPAQDKCTLPSCCRDLLRWEGQQSHGGVLVFFSLLLQSGVFFTTK